MAFYKTNLQRIKRIDNSIGWGIIGTIQTCNEDPMFSEKMRNATSRGPNGGLSVKGTPLLLLTGIMIWLIWRAT